jgi:hypothetical protein
MGPNRRAQERERAEDFLSGFPPQCGIHNRCMGWGGDGPDRCTQSNNERSGP